MGQHVPWVAPATARLPAGLCLLVLSRQRSPVIRTSCWKERAAPVEPLWCQPCPCPARWAAPSVRDRLSVSEPDDKGGTCVAVCRWPGGAVPQWGPEGNPPLCRLPAVCRLLGHGLWGLRGVMGGQRCPLEGREGVRSGPSGCCIGRFPRFLCAWKQGRYREWLKPERDDQCAGGCVHKREPLVPVHFLLSSLCFPSVVPAVKSVASVVTYTMLGCHTQTRDCESLAGVASGSCHPGHVSTQRRGGGAGDGSADCLECAFPE